MLLIALNIHIYIYTFVLTPILVLFILQSRNLGEKGGLATFAVEVPSAGDYAVNVGYFAALDRHLTVKVNHGNFTLFKFRKSSGGGWCRSETGKANVLPIELEGLVQGQNNITFGARSIDNGPFLEWISVVI